MQAYMNCIAYSLIPSITACERHMAVISLSLYIAASVYFSVHLHKFTYDTL